MDQVCYISEKGQKDLEMEKPSYNETAKTLTIKAANGMTIDAFAVRMLQLSGPGDTYNFCDVYSSGWIVDNKNFDNTTLDGHEAVIFLTSPKHDYQMELSLQMGDSSYSDEKLERALPIINVQVSIVEGDQNVYTVPAELVDVQDKLKCKNNTRCKLSEYVDIDNSANPIRLVTIYSNSTVNGRVPVWALNANIQEEYLNLI